VVKKNQTDSNLRRMEYSIKVNIIEEAVFAIVTSLYYLIVPLFTRQGAGEDRSMSCTGVQI
jgi:hypothetical protein